MDYKEVIEYQTQTHYHSVTASIGKLICLQLIDVSGKPLDIICEGWSWQGPKSELRQGAKMARTSGPADRKPAQGGGNDDPWASQPDRQSGFGGKQASNFDDSNPPF